MTEFFSLSHKPPKERNALFPSTFWNQTKFHLGLLSLSWFLKNFWVRFAQPLDTNIHIGFVSLGLLDQAESHHSALWIQTNFDVGSLSLGLIFQIVLAFISLSLWTPTHI